VVDLVMSVASVEGDVLMLEKAYWSEVLGSFEFHVHQRSQTMKSANEREEVEMLLFVDVQIVAAFVVVAAAVVGLVEVSLGWVVHQVALAWALFVSQAASLKLTINGGDKKARQFFLFVFSVEILEFQFSFLLFCGCHCDAQCLRMLTNLPLLFRTRLSYLCAHT
jgi:hypothetical protein